LPAELTVRIAAYAQLQHQEGRKDDIADDEGSLSFFADFDYSSHEAVAVLWKAFLGLQGAERAKAIERIGDLEYMVDHETGHPIVNLVKYIGPKAGHKITPTKACPIFQVCKRLRHEGADFVRGVYFHVNLLHKGLVSQWDGKLETRMAIAQALITMSEEIERLPMLRHLKIAFYNIDKGHRCLQYDWWSSQGMMHGADPHEISAWYSKILESMTSVAWSDCEVRSGGYTTPESWLTFVYELRDADIPAALADIQNWREQGAEIFENE
jgi:hypothetical protein